MFVETVNISDINNDAISKVLKLAAMQLAYPEIKVIEIKVIKPTPSDMGGGGVLYLGEYKDREIQKRDYGGQKHSNNTSQTNHIPFIIRLRPIPFLL